MLDRNLFPENLVQACFQQVKTIYVPKESDIVPVNAVDVNATTVAPTTVATTTVDMWNATNVTEEVPMMRALQYQDGMNVLGMIF